MKTFYEMIWILENADYKDNLHRNKNLSRYEEFVDRELDKIGGIGTEDIRHESGERGNVQDMLVDCFDEGLTPRQAAMKIADHLESKGFVIHPEKGFIGSENEMGDNLTGNWPPGHWGGKGRFRSIWPAGRENEKHIPRQELRGPVILAAKQRLMANNYKNL